MGRGRKSISNFSGSDWETVFYNSVGTYVQYINIELSKEHKLEPLSNHLKIVGGYAFKTNEYKKQGIPIIRISDFSNEQIVLKDVVYYEEAKELEKYKLVQGDIIIALTGGTIAKLAIVQEGLGKIYLNQRVGKFQVLNPDEFDVEYIYWLARSIQSIIKNLAWGAAIPNVSPKQIEALEFAFPTKEIQRGIIIFLNDLKNNNLQDDKIYFNEEVENKIIALQEKQITASSISTELTNQLTLLKKLRQQLLQDAVQGKLLSPLSLGRGAGGEADEPANKLLQKIKAEKEKLIAEKKLKKEKELPPITPDEIPFEIPESWVWCRLGEIAYITSGSTPSQDAFVKEGIPYLKMYNLRNQKIDFFHKPQYIKADVHNGQLKRCRAYPGDVIMNIVGPPLGKIAIIPDDLPECNFNQAAVLIRPLIKTMNLFIFWYLNEMSEINSIDTKGVAGQNNISVTQAHNMRIPLPPLSQQILIVQKLETLMQYCNKLETSIKQSQTQNQQLLQQVLREALRKEPVGV
jgi:type I restriction enzyme S subunit